MESGFKSLYKQPTIVPPADYSARLQKFCKDMMTSKTDKSSEPNDRGTLGDLQN